MDKMLLNRFIKKALTKHYSKLYSRPVSEEEIGDIDTYFLVTNQQNKVLIAEMDAAPNAGFIKDTITAFAQEHGYDAPVFETVTRLKNSTG